MFCNKAIFCTTSEKDVILFCILVIQSSSSVLALLNECCNKETVRSKFWVRVQVLSYKMFVTFSISAHCVFLQGSSTFYTHSSLLGFHIEHGSTQKHMWGWCLFLTAVVALFLQSSPFLLTLSIPHLPTNISCMYFSLVLLLWVCIQPVEKNVVDILASKCTGLWLLVSLCWRREEVAEKILFSAFTGYI